MSTFKEETMYSLVYQYGPLIVLSTFYIMFMKLSLFEKKSETKKPLDDSTTTTTNPNPNTLHSRQSPPTHHHHEHKHDLRHILQQYTLYHYLHRTALLVLRAFLRCTPSITLSPLSLHFTNPPLPLPLSSPSLSNVECSPTPDIKQMCDTIEYKLAHSHRRSDSAASSMGSISQYRVEALPQIKAACDELTALCPLRGSPSVANPDQIYYDKLEFEDENEYDSDSLDDHFQIHDDHESNGTALRPDITDILNSMSRSKCHRSTVRNNTNCNVSQSPVIEAESVMDDLDRFSKDLDRTYLSHEEDSSSSTAKIEEEVERQNKEMEELEGDLLEWGIDVSLFPTEEECYPHKTKVFTKKCFK